MTSPRERAATTLPAWSHVLAVVAHPDDESFGLGAVLAAFADAGSRVSVLCLTRGEASTLQTNRGTDTGDLATIRSNELEAAARQLGLEQTIMLSNADGNLAEADHTELLAEIDQMIRSTGTDGLIVFDPSGVTGHPDHAAASAAAARAAQQRDLPVLGWTVPDSVADTLNHEYQAAFTGHPAAAVDLRIRVDRARQRAAVHAHTSQAVATSVLWRRLELLGDTEHLRYLTADR